MKKTAKTKVIVKKRGAIKPVVKRLDEATNQLSLKELTDKLGPNFGEVVATRSKQNPFRAETKDGLNVAFGQSKEQAVQNLLIGIANRT